MERAATALARLLPQLLRGAPVADGPLLAWPLVCGASVAGRTRAVSFCDGILRVEVRDAAWQTQLADLAPHYLASLNGLLDGCYPAGRNQEPATPVVIHIEFVLPPGAQSEPARHRGRRRKALP